MHIAEVTREQSKDLILNVHYARRMPSMSYCYGLFEGNKLLGVVSYGRPLSSTLRKAICGEEHLSSVWELTRLVFYDNKKNQASKLISGSLKLLRQKVGNIVVVSFADTAQGHAGYVYQASNFHYCGLSAKRTDWAVVGLEHIHSQTLSDQVKGAVNGRANALRDMYGDRFYNKPRSRKHRYVIFVGGKKFVKSATKSLSYKIEPYPKLVVDRPAA